MIFPVCQHVETAIEFRFVEHFSVDCPDGVLSELPVTIGASFEIQSMEVVPYLIVFADFYLNHPNNWTPGH